MAIQDQLHRYLFSHAAVRGELVNVSQTWQDMVSGHDYPPAVQQLLAELVVATSLLTATLKFAGEITVQLQGNGPVTLMVINGNHRQEMRGVARVQGNIPPDASFQTLVGEGYLVITITPEKGEQYQGIVGLQQDTLAGCLEEYFMRSEQLPTRLFIHTGEVAGKAGAGGILLQKLPSADSQGDDDFHHLALLTETLKTEELLSLSAREILWRLYHQEEATLYEPQPVVFKCTCSRERCGEILKLMAPSEVDEMLQEDGEIDMHCDYCGRHYRYDAVDIAALRSHSVDDPQDPQYH